MNSYTEITALDHTIFQRGHMTVNIERLPSSLQISKKDAPLTLTERIRENGRLRQEIAHYEELLGALRDVFEASKEVHRLLYEMLAELPCHPDEQNALASMAEKAGMVFTLLRRALREASNRMMLSEGRLLEYFGISLDNTFIQDFTVL
jgi:hypothetical protein